MVAGEVRTECYVPIDEIVRRTIRDIGYTRAKFGFDADNVGVLAAIHGQSDDIAQAWMAWRTSATAPALATRA